MRGFYVKLIQKLLWLTLFAAISVSAETMLVSGSTSLYPVFNESMLNYQKTHPDIVIKLESVGSGVGIKRLIEGRIDIALSSRFVTDKEVRDAASKNVYLVPFRIAYDYVLPVVHPANPIKDLSLEQLNKIYTGEIDNWRQIGGADLPVQVVTREKTSGTFSLWSEKILNDAEMVSKVKTVSSNAEMVAFVSSHKNAIGYISRGYLNSYLKPISIAGSYATVKSAVNEQYPLSRTLFLFTRGWPAGETLKFINFVVCSESGRKIVSEAGLIPIGQLAY